MTKNLNIYVATMTGTALMVADEIEEFCKTEGINTNIVEMDALEPKNLEDAEKMMQSLTKEIDEASGSDLKQRLKQFIPEYQPALDS